MFITIASDKGGVGKTTTAINLAQALQEDRPTLLIDADRSRRALTLAKIALNAGTPYPFSVVPEHALFGVAEQYPIAKSHIIVDTRGQPEVEDLISSIEQSDLIIIPTEADPQSLASLPKFIAAIEEQLAPYGDSKKYRILLTNIPPPPQKDGAETRAVLLENNLKVFTTYIRSYKCHKMAFARGLTVDKMRTDPYSVSAWADCEALADEVLHKL